MMTTVTEGDVRAWLGEMSTAGYLNLDADSRALATHALALLDGAKPAPPVEPLPPGYLSPHFTLAELTRSDTANAMGVDNSAPPSVEANLVKLADALEKVRAICGDNPIFVSSGYRSPPVNSAVGGASNSAHLFGLAADFTIPGFGPVLAVCRALEPHLVEVGIDQLIDESGGGARWVHLGLAIPPNTTPRHQALTINASGTTTGFA